MNNKHAYLIWKWDDIEVEYKLATLDINTYKRLTDDLGVPKGVMK